MNIFSKYYNVLKYYNNILKSITLLIPFENELKG